jgi:RNA polymerase sigma factor (sigma-70 family)
LGHELRLYYVDPLTETAAPPTEGEGEGEARALRGEEHREVLLAALRRLPDRQREAVVLRYCLALPEHEVAEAMKISRRTVKSASHRGLAALVRILKEDSGHAGVAAAR